MKQPEKIRRQVSNIFGVLIGDGEWDETFALLDRENRLNSKNMNKVLLVVLKKLEEMESAK